jgi:mannopine transport system permease protein
MTMRGGLSRGTAALMALPLAALMIAAFVWPLVAFLSVSLFDPGFTLEHYAKLFATELYLDVLGETILTALIVTAVTLLLGYPIAWMMAKLSGRWAWIVAACVLIPLWTPVLVRSYAWIIILQRRGVLNTTLVSLGIVDQPLTMLYTFGAVVLAMTHVLMPFMILPIQSSLRAIPDELPRAARGLGASQLRVFTNIILPLSLPGVMAGCLMVFIIALGFYITPALVGGPRTLMISTLITQQAFELLNWPFAAAISTVLLVLTLGIAIVFRRLLNVDRLSLHA